MRRLYDIVNIFSAIGCCYKSGLHSMTWTGLVNLTGHMRDAARTRGLDDPSSTLVSLFQTPCPTGMGNLSVDYLLLYAALRSSRLDLRMVATLFSRGTRTFRSTLCKLYQIAFILCAAGVTTRTDMTCEVALMTPYINFEILPANQKDYINPLDLSTMLNRQTNSDLDGVYRLRDEFRRIWAASGNKNVAVNGTEFSRF
jgi:hypothetical protein